LDSVNNISIIIATIFCGEDNIVGRVQTILIGLVAAAMDIIVETTNVKAIGRTTLVIIGIGTVCEFLICFILFGECGNNFDSFQDFLVRYF